MGTIQVLHVDDESGFGDLVAEFLQREDEAMTVVTETSAAEALDRLRSGTEHIDCIVSDYDMPGMDGLEFLNEIREDRPDLPFILYTGKGSEAVASEAMSKGATDYLQKESGSQQYELLANRVRNTVEQYRSGQEAKRTRRRLENLTESSTDCLWMFSADWEELLFISGYEDVWNRPTEAIREDPQDFLNGVDPEYRDDVREAMAQCSAGEPIDIEYKIRRGDDESGWVWVKGRPVFDEDGDVTRVVGFTRDITERKERERRLERYERIVGNLPVGVFRTTLDGEFVDANEHAVSLLGADSLDHLREHTVPEVYADPADRAPLMTEVKSEGAIEGRSVDFQTLDGGGFKAEVSFKLIEEGGAQYLDGIMRDITERKERERELRKSERRYQAILEDPNILAGVLDTDGTLVEQNRTAMEYIDAEMEEVVGEPFWETPWWSTDEQRRAVRENVERAAEGEYVEYEADLTKPDGEPYSVEGVIRPVTDDTGEVVSLIVSARDVTERKRRKRELERIRDRTELTLQETDAVIWERDPETGSITTYPEICPLVDERIRTVEDYRETIHPEDRPAVEDTVQTVIDRREPASVEYRTTDAVDPEWIEAQIHPVVEDGTVSMLTGISTDITERKRRELQLERQNERFDELASAVSHDLQTPLQTAQGRAELAVETGETEQMERALAAIERADELRENLVEVLRTKEVVDETESVDVGRIGRRAWKTVSPPEDAAIAVHDAPRVEGDPKALRRLLENLLSNAVEHGGADVTVRIGRTDGGFHVEDDGPGIPPDDREAVFTPGFSTKRDGSGIGLASVRQIAMAHDWTIRVAESDAGGARFEFETGESPPAEPVDSTA